MTSKQRETLNFIRTFIWANDYSPSIREIMEGIGTTSTGRTHQIVSALERLGCIKRDSARHRSIELIEQHPDISKIPTNVLLAEIGRRQVVEMAQ